jgi:O-antigen ligase
MNHNRIPSIRLLLAMVLFFFIAAEISIVGRAYFSVTNLRADTIRSEYETLLHATIVLPLLILITRNWRVPLLSRTPGAVLFVIGIWLWLVGSILSAIAHRDMPQAIAFLFIEVVSGSLVYFASRSLILSENSIEQIVRCMMFGGLIPGVQGVWAFYKGWGIPSPEVLLYARYNLARMEPYTLAVGHTGAAACFFAILAAPCMVILALKLFRNSTRILVGLTLFFCVANLMIDQSRTSFIVVTATWMFLLLFIRRVRYAIALAAGIILFLTFSSSSAVDIFYQNLSRAVTYSRADRSASDRLDSIAFGWRTFIENPLYGVGPGQSSLYNPFVLAHDLIVYQASEVGFLGFVGVILITIGCTVRLIELVRRGPGNEMVRLKFTLLLGPGMYFGAGTVSSVFLYNTFHNGWICLVCGLIGLSEARYLRPSRWHIANHAGESRPIVAVV